MKNKNRLSYKIYLYLKGFLSLHVVSNALEFGFCNKLRIF